MKTVLLLYFSAVGSTKKLAYMIQNHIQKHCDLTLCSFEDVQEIDLRGYDAFIIGTPVYHAAPARFVTDFFENIMPLPHAVPAFIYNTRALWSCNTNRILAKKLRARNIVTIMDRDYRSPASDGSLIAPSVRRFFEFDKHLFKKLKKDCALFVSKIMKPVESVKQTGYIPRFRFSSILNAPNKLAGLHTTFQIYLHREKCLRCGKCIAACPHCALQKNSMGYPVVNRKKCTNCYRCIHHCPGKALSINKRKPPQKQLFAGR